MLIVGIDVGGTHTKVGVVEDGKIIRSMQLTTNTFDVVRQIVNATKEFVQSAEKSWEEVDGIAVGFPGMVIDSVVLDSPNINLQNCNLKDILSKEFGKPVIVKNDAEMATLAEHKIGSGADCDNMLLITLGTGVGGGIIANHKLYVGEGGAGELGHIVFERNGKPCTCGRQGCAEQYVSMSALDKLSKDIMDKYPNTCITINNEGQVYASELIRAYKRNDKCAIEIVDKYVDFLTEYILDLCNMFRPNRIVIGGGISYAPELIDMVARNCRRLEYGYKNSPKVDIVCAQLGNQAGILGGFVCFQEESFAEEDGYFENDLQSELSFAENKAILQEDNLLDAENSSISNESAVEEQRGVLMSDFINEISEQIDNIKKEQFDQNSIEDSVFDNSEKDYIVDNIEENSDSGQTEQVENVETESVVDTFSIPEDAPQADEDEIVEDNDLDNDAKYEEDVSIGLEEKLQSLGRSELTTDSDMSLDDIPESEDDEEGENQLSEEEMYETEVVYSDNLLDRVNALLKNKNK